MPPVTLETILARQAELATLIEQLQQPAQQSTQLDIQATTIELQPGEHYAGAVLDENGRHKHHLVLMAPCPEGNVDWDNAMKWAASVGGVLPTRQEQALLYANCKPHLQPEWHWSSEAHSTDASCAWKCGFTSGYQNHYHKSFEGSAVAVRRF